MAIQQHPSSFNVLPFLFVVIPAPEPVSSQPLYLTYIPKGYLNIEQLDPGSPIASGMTRRKHLDI
jgi:hypothetical protein